TLARPIGVMDVGVSWDARPHERSPHVAMDVPVSPCAIRCNPCAEFAQAISRPVVRRYLSDREKLSLWRLALPRRLRGHAEIPRGHCLSIYRNVDTVFAGWEALRILEMELGHRIPRERHGLFCVTDHLGAVPPSYANRSFAAAIG